MERIQDKCRPYDPTKKVYLKFRWVLVDWMCDLGDSIKVSQNTIHHAVAMMDTYFSIVADPLRNDSKGKGLQLIAFTCIFFSAKFCEKDSRGPTAHDISYLSQKMFSEKDIIKSETLVLNTLGWNLMAATPIEFIRIFQWLGVLFSDDRVANADSYSLPNSKTVDFINKYLEFFVDLVL